MNACGIRQSDAGERRIIRRNHDQFVFQTKQISFYPHIHALKSLIESIAKGNTPPKHQKT